MKIEKKNLNEALKVLGKVVSQLKMSNLKNSVKFRNRDVKNGDF